VCNGVQSGAYLGGSIKCIWKRGVKCGVRSMMCSIEYRYMPVYHSNLATSYYGIPSKILLPPVMERSKRGKC